MDNRVADLATNIRSLSTKLKRRLREQGGADDLTPSQIAALLRLESDGPMTVTALASAEGMRPQSMGATTATLETAGLIAGAADPNDGRQTIWSLTPACKKWIRDGRAARQDWLCRAIEAKLSMREQEKLAQAIELLKRVVEA